MANIIKLKRRTSGGAAGSPSGLASGEPAFNEVSTDLNLYYGAGDNGSGQATSVIVIGGFGSVFQAKVTAFRLDQFAAPAAAVSMAGFDLTNLPSTPGSPNAAASKAYVDAQAQQSAAGIDSKPSVRLVTTAAVTTSGLSAIDGVTPNAGDRILRAATTPDASNGPWVAASGAWTRPTDADQTGEITPGAEWYVEEGSTYGKTKWRVVNTGAITLGTTSITITQSEAASVITAGNGLSTSDTAKTNFIVVPDVGISVSATGVRISATYAGQTSITTLGTVGTGTWQGTAVALGYGGTGANLTTLSDGAILKKVGAAIVQAVSGTDYLSNTSVVDGGVF